MESSSHPLPNSSLAHPIPEEPSPTPASPRPGRPQKWKSIESRPVGGNCMESCSHPLRTTIPEDSPHTPAPPCPQEGLKNGKVSKVGPLEATARKVPAIH